MIKRNANSYKIFYIFKLCLNLLKRVNNNGGTREGPIFLGIRSV